MNQIDSENNKPANIKANELIGKTSPELLLELNQQKTRIFSSPSSISKPTLLVILLIFFDILIAIFLNVYTGESHIFPWPGHFGLILSLPWGLAFLDGLVLAGYGIYVIKNKHGEIDIEPTNYGPNEVHEISGEAASVLGYIYVFLGIILVGAVIARLFIQGIF